MEKNCFSRATKRAAGAAHPFEVSDGGNRPLARVSPVLQGWARLLGDAEGDPLSLPCLSSQLLPGESRQDALDHCLAAGTGLPGATGLPGVLLWLRPDPTPNPRPPLSIPPPLPGSPPARRAPARLHPPPFPGARWKRPARTEQRHRPASQRELAGSSRAAPRRAPVPAGAAPRTAPGPAPAPRSSRRGRWRRRREPGGSGRLANPALTMMEKTRATTLMGQTGQKQENMASSR